MRQDIVMIEPDEGLRTWGWVSYVLHLIVAVAAVLPGAQVSIALLLVALMIDLVKRGEAANTWQASHFTWRIRSVVWAGVLYVLTSWLWLIFIIPGWIAWGLISLWFLYRIVKGAYSLNGSRGRRACGAARAHDGAGAEAGDGAGLQSVPGRRFSHHDQYRHRGRPGSASPASSRHRRRAAVAQGLMGARVA